MKLIELLPLIERSTVNVYEKRRYGPPKFIVLINPGANKGCKQRLIEWLKQPYKKLPYKLSQFEFDLLNAYKNSGMRQCISNYGTLLEMYGKGHFKGIDTSTPIREILDNCKVV